MSSSSSTSSLPSITEGNNSEEVTVEMKEEDDEEEDVKSATTRSDPPKDPLDAYVEHLQRTDGSRDTSVFWDVTTGAAPMLFRIDGTLIKSTQELLQMSEQASFGKGEETVTDLTVRKTRKVRGADIQVKWPALETAVVTAQQALRQETTHSHRWHATLHDVLVYQPGDFFAGHRDSKKAPTHIATMSVVIDLPGASEYEGGDVVFPNANRRWKGQRETCGQPATNRAGTPWGAWFASELHSVEEVKSGQRVVATFVLTEDAPTGTESMEMQRPGARVEETGPPKRPPKVGILSLPSLSSKRIASYLGTIDLLHLGSVCTTFHEKFASQACILYSLVRERAGRGLPLRASGTSVRRQGSMVSGQQVHVSVELQLEHRYTSTKTESARDDRAVPVEDMMIEPGQLRGTDASLLHHFLTAFVDAQETTVNIIPVDLIHYQELRDEYNDDSDESMQSGTSRFVGVREVPLATYKRLVDPSAKGTSPPSESTPSAGSAASSQEDPSAPSSQADTEGLPHDGVPTKRSRDGGKSKRRSKKVVELPCELKGGDDWPPLLVYQQYFSSMFDVSYPAVPYCAIKLNCNQWSAEWVEDLGEYQGNERSFKYDWHRAAIMRMDFLWQE